MKTLAPHIERERLAHHAALLSLYNGEKPTTGLNLWRQLCRVERLASDAATAQCNGTDYNGQPFREEKEWDEFDFFIHAKVRKIMGGNVVGFFFNKDPRGYALKIDPDNGRIPAGMHQDWGKNGILAAQID